MVDDLLETALQKVLLSGAGEELKSSLSKLIEEVVAVGGIDFFAGGVDKVCAVREEVFCIFVGIETNAFEANTFHLHQLLLGELDCRLELNKRFEHQHPVLQPIQEELRNVLGVKRPEHVCDVQKRTPDFDQLLRAQGSAQLGEALLSQLRERLPEQLDYLVDFHPELVAAERKSVFLKMSLAVSSAGSMVFAIRHGSDYESEELWPLTREVDVCNFKNRLS